MNNIINTPDYSFPQHKDKSVVNGPEALKLYMQAFRHYVDPNRNTVVDYSCLNDTEDLTHVLKEEMKTTTEAYQVDTIESIANAVNVELV